MTPVLWYLPYSPWSEKVRWVLDVRGVTCERRLFQPVIGEPALRRLRADGRGSVPVLEADGRVIGDSGDIAILADGQGSGRSLIPEGGSEAVARYDALAERGLCAGRVLALRRVLGDRDALVDLVPRSLRWAGPLAAQAAAIGVRRTLRKYGSDATSIEVARADLVAVLEQLRADLAAAPDGDPRFLLGAFSLADIAMAQVFAFVAPPTAGLRLGAGSRRCFHDAALAAEFADLVRWRDALYAGFRGIPARSRKGPFRQRSDGRSGPCERGWWWRDPVRRAR